MSFTIRLTGVNTARAAIKRYAAERRHAVEKEIARAVFKIDETAKSLVAVDTGRLRASITPLIYNGGLSGSVGTNVNYAFSQEFGDPAFPNKRFTPFLTPALKANEQAFLAALRKVMSQKP